MSAKKRVVFKFDERSLESSGVPVATEMLGEFVRKHQLTVDALTEKQLAEVIRQAIDSGDITRNILQDGSAQSVTYIPWREVDRYRTLYHELLYAVAAKFEGESRHETALRYIREREAPVGATAGETPKDS